jgi:hypothetical protein
LYRQKKLKKFPNNNAFKLKLWQKKIPAHLCTGIFYF